MDIYDYVNTKFIGKDNIEILPGDAAWDDAFVTSRATFWAFFKAFSEMNISVASRCLKLSDTTSVTAWQNAIDDVYTAADDYLVKQYLFFNSLIPAQETGSVVYTNASISCVYESLEDTDTGTSIFYATPVIYQSDLTIDYTGNTTFTEALYTNQVTAFKTMMKAIKRFTALTMNWQIGEFDFPPAKPINGKTTPVDPSI